MADDAGKGLNFGWSAFEGTHRYNDDQSPDGAVGPVFEYAHGRRLLGQRRLRLPRRRDPGAATAGTSTATTATGALWSVVDAAGKAG